MFDVFSDEESRVEKRKEKLKVKWRYELKFRHLIKREEAVI